MTGAPRSDSDRAALAWRTVRAYEDPERYRDVAGPEHRDALARPPAALGQPDAEHASVQAYLAHSCDLAFSGGLATAVAAPLAACALAEHYVVRRVGGAGVAALSATAVTAAEFARTSGADRGEGPADDAEVRVTATGYPGLARLVGWLAGDHDHADGGREQQRIARLLPPAPGLAGVHRLLTALIAPARGPAGRVRAVLPAALALPRGPAAAAAGLVWAGALLAWIGITIALLRSPTVAGWVVALLALALLVTVVLAGLAASAIAAFVTLRELLGRRTADEHFGLVAGVPVAEPAQGRPVPDHPALDRAARVPDPAGLPPLACWFADLVDDVAGVPPGDDDRHALTFGDLWLGRLATPDDGELLRRAASDAEHRVVDLRLVATDVTRGRPVRLPLTGSANARWLLCSSCWEAVLPGRVVDQVLAASPHLVAEVCPRHRTPLRPMPPPWDFPVAAAARIAATVPGLLRAVPLHRTTAPAPVGVRDTYRGSTGRGEAEPAGATVTTHWFTGSPPADAPASMFDSGPPRWPTVALSVVHDPTAADDGHGPWVDTPDADAAPPPASPPAPADGAGFARATLAAASGWRDRMAAELPGTRNRIGIVRRGAGATTGPFMPDDEVLRLALRGHHAGRELRERFTGHDGEIEAQTGTDRYRWARIRVALRDQRREGLAVAARVPLLSDLSAPYRVPAAVAAWFTPPIAPGRLDPAWADAAAALTHLRTLTDGGVLDWDTDYGAPPADPDEPGI